MSYGKLETWKVVYNPIILDAGKRGVAFVEASSRQQALHIFMEEFRGQYHTVDTCEKLF